MHGLPDHFNSFRRVAGTLEQAGNRQVFCGRLLGMTEAFMYHCQVRAGKDVLGIQLGNTHPVFEGLFGFLVLDVKFGGFQEGLDGLLILPTVRKAGPLFPAEPGRWVQTWAACI